eukprot:s675_g34.t1
MHMHAHIYIVWLPVRKQDLQGWRVLRSCRRSRPMRYMTSLQQLPFEQLLTSCSCIILNQHVVPQPPQIRWPTNQCCSTVSG